jgi:nucleotide-binding universal stress UspA family protein
MKTRRLKKVLIALDYDPTAQIVAEAGFSLAKALKAEVILINVISDPAYYSSAKPFTVMGFAGQIETDMLPVKSVMKLKKVSQQYLDKSKHHLGDITIQTIVAEGDPAESILLTVKKKRADIIVLGTHSRNRLGSLVMGSVTEKVMRQTSVPVFIIPTRKASQI